MQQQGREPKAFNSNEYIDDESDFTAAKIDQTEERLSLIDIRQRRNKHD